MTAGFRRFFLDETGATTADWVVLAGGCIALTVAMLSTMNGSMSSVATELEGLLGRVQVVELGEIGRAEAGPAEEEDGLLGG